MSTESKIAAAVGLVVLIAVVAWTLRGQDPAAPEVSPEEPEVSGDAVPADDSRFEAELDSLREEAAAVSRRGPDGARELDRESFVTHARLIADSALDAKRPDVTAAVGRILVEADEEDFAGAVLQRAVGLMKADKYGKDHYYALAEIRRSQGRPVEAASLFERVVHAPPTLAAEYVGLSEQYLASDRLGPAAAAVDRGLRSHPGDPMLGAQGAKVQLLQGDAEGALVAADALLQDDPTDLAARLVRIEARLATGELDGAVEDAAALRAEAPDDAWGWIFGAAAARSRGFPAKEMLTRARDLAGDCPCTREERLAIDWAAKVGTSARVTPRSRVDIAP